MRRFDELFSISADRKGGAGALEAMLSRPAPPEELAKIPDSQWLETLSKSVFQAGFNWKVVEAKWDGFRVAFHEFDPGWCALMDDETFDALVTDTRIIRNATKILSIRDNAAFLNTLADRGGAGTVLGGWPSTDFIGLLEFLKKNGARLGGVTGQYSMRFAGRDAFILSRDVTARLIAEGVIDKPATSKGAMKKVQDAFNNWMAQSGRSLNEISRVLAMSL